MPLLANHSFEELRQAAVDAGLASAERRQLLLRNMPESFATSLPVLSRPRDQLLSDLHELNSVSQVSGLDKPPLVIWLDNAISLSSASHFVEICHRLREVLQPSLIKRSHLSKSQTDFVELESRRDLVETSLARLRQPSRSYRAIVVGPLFLHPPWYIERRNRKVQIANYDEALADYVKSTALVRSHDVRFIFTNSKRYRTKVETYVKSQERRKFQEDLLKAIDLLWGSIGDRGPDLCCVHPGFLHIQSIFDDAVITTYRLSPATPTSVGLISYRDEIIQRERAHFDNVFDTCSNGQEEELRKLVTHIKELW